VIFIDGSTFELSMQFVLQLLLLLVNKRSTNILYGYGEALLYNNRSFLSEDHTSYLISNAEIVICRIMMLKAVKLNDLLTYLEKKGLWNCKAFILLTKFCTLFVALVLLTIPICS
jgi:hypothetical protein